MKMTVVQVSRVGSYLSPHSRDPTTDCNLHNAQNLSTSAKYPFHHGISSSLRDGLRVDRIEEGWVKHASSGRIHFHFARNGCRKHSQEQRFWQFRVHAASTLEHVRSSDHVEHGKPQRPLLDAHVHSKLGHLPDEDVAKVLLESEILGPESDTEHRTLVTHLSEYSIRSTGEEKDNDDSVEHVSETERGSSFDTRAGAETVEAVGPSEQNGIVRLWERITGSMSPRFKGLVLLNILTLLYGSNVSVIKEAQGGIDPFTFSSMRFIIAAAAFSPFLRTAMKNPSVRIAGIELGIWASVGYMLQAVGLLTTDAGRAAFIGTFTVIEVPIIAGFFGVKIPPITWASALAALVGVGLLETAGGNSSPLGDFWTMMSALLFGIHMLRSEHHARHVPEGAGLSLIALQLAVIAFCTSLWTGVMHLTMAPVPGVAAILTGDWPVISSWPWLEMTYTGVLSTAFCLWVEVVSLRDVSASEAAMVYTLEPLYGAAFAWVLLGERWGLKGWAGAALILGGSLTMQLLGKVEDLPEEKSSPSSSSAIVAALGVGAALALLLAASSSPESMASVSEVPVPQGDVFGNEIENLTTLIRAYALAKIDAEAEGGGHEA